MESIISSLQSAVSYAVPMIVLLGLLIFVHELGHFAVAKYFKVRVEVFSLGFGPKLLKFKRGDTVYAISAIPLGGYVKMFGDDPMADIPADQKAHSLTAKPVGQRIAVVLAGPMMNFFFAILIFAVVAKIGEPKLAAKLGDVETNTPAYAAGFRSGDAITSVDGAAPATWEDFENMIESGASKQLAINVNRTAAGSTEAKPVTLQVTPKLTTNKNPISWDREVGEVDGLSYSAKASIVGIGDPTSLAAKAGLRTGDIIESINGQKLTQWRDLQAMIDKAPVGAPIEFGVERGLMETTGKEDEPDKTTHEKVSIAMPNVAAEKRLSAMGIEFPELFLASVEKGSPAERAGLKKADRLVSIDHHPVKTFEEVAGFIRSFGKSDKADAAAAPAPLDVVVLRDGKETNVAVSPNMKERMTNVGRSEKRFEIGIRPLIIDAPPATIDLKFSNPFTIVQRGVSQTLKWSSLTVLSFVRLFQHEVSPKNIGGILSIGQMAKKSWSIGPSQFLNVMAIISINLFVLNLLPVPVLDGGHLVFYSIEALRGAPLSLRKMEIASQVGLVLLLALMMFALFNDVSRVFLQ